MNRAAGFAGAELLRGFEPREIDAGLLDGGFVIRITKAGGLPN
ncbi:hypothetical protein [Fodinibius sediminis]|nr:hypothetical protein [Fodinibius sediminis]